MRKIFTKILCVAAASVMTVGVFSMAACGSSKPLSNDYEGTVSQYDNGGFAVKKGKYVYFINGREKSSATNKYGKVVKGAVMRISESDLAAKNYNKVEAVVPEIVYSGNTDGGIFIYGDRIYYTSPAIEKNSGGEVQNSYLSFKSSKLDGTDVTKKYYLQYPNNSIQYRYVTAEDGTVYLLYVATSENLYGTSYTNLHSVNTKTGKNTLLAYNVDTIMFDGSDLTNPRVYYTMNVPNFGSGSTTATFDKYNQIYTVTADATEPNDYKIGESVKDYDKSKDPIYVNCGTLVLDGIGKVDTAESVTNFNAPELLNGGTVSRPAYKYTLSSYDHGNLFYTRKSDYDTSAALFAESDVTLTARANQGKQATGNDGVECILEDGGSASDYTYLFNGTTLTGALVSDSVGLIKAAYEDGKLIVDPDDDKTFYIAKVEGGESKPTVLFTEPNGNDLDIYYSTAATDYDVHRITYKSGASYDDYNKLPLNDDEINEYSSVKVLDIVSSSSWYKPEMFNGQILFATETATMTDYDYVMVCDIRNAQGNVMSNEELSKLNEKYQGIEEKFDAIDSSVYENLASALRYVKFSGTPSYLRELINEYVKVKGYKETHFWSVESLAKYDEFVSATGEWEEYNASVKVNGSDVLANRRDYYYSLLGTMKASDATAFADYLKTNYLKEWPEQEPGWFESLSKGAKAGFLVGVIGGGLLIIAGAVVGGIFIARKKKTKLPTYTKRRVKVDVSDNKDVDIYGTGGEPEAEPAPESTPKE